MNLQNNPASPINPVACFWTNGGISQTKSDMMMINQDSHVGGVGLQAAYDHGDGGEWIGDVSQHHTGRFGP